MCIRDSFPLSWNILPARSIQDRSNSKNNIWQNKLRSWLVHQGYELWLQRNNSLYEQHKSTTALESIFNNKICQLYRLQDDIGYHDCGLFQVPLAERLNMSVNQKMTWIEQTSQTMKVNMEEHQQKMRTGQKDISQFFQKSNEKQKN